jgi:hypothetical protein
MPPYSSLKLRPLRGFAKTKKRLVTAHTKQSLQIAPWASQFRGRRPLRATVFA